MKRFKLILLIILFIMTLAIGTVVSAEEIQQSRAGAYLVVEGGVSSVTARMLLIDGQQYPVSMFVRVFDRGEKGQEMPMHTVAGIGKIDKARLYILGGKVEKIVVLKNL